MAEDSNEFYWDNFFVKVEDMLFCVPRCEFVQSSEVFADMFLLPSGPATCIEGQDRDHPIVLEGYKKDEFTCLLKVMYPTARSLISGRNFELDLKNEEWVSVLKLSTIWNMTKIRQYAIYWLSNNASLSPIEKILLARAHRVGAWLDEGVTSFVTCDPVPTLEELSTLGWETAARLLWMRSNFSPNTLHFTRDAIKCSKCSSSSSLINANYACGHIASGDAGLIFYGSAPPISKTVDLLVPIRQIQCPICRGNPFVSNHISCKSCSSHCHPNNLNVRFTWYKLKTMIEEMFGDEIKDYYEPRLLDS